MDKYHQHLVLLVDLGVVLLVDLVPEQVEMEQVIHSQETLLIILLQMVGVMMVVLQLIFNKEVEVVVLVLLDM